MQTCISNALKSAHGANIFDVGGNKIIEDMILDYFWLNQMMKMREKKRDLSDSTSYSKSSASH